MGQKPKVQIFEYHNFRKHVFLMDFANSDPFAQRNAGIGPSFFSRVY